MKRIFLLVIVLLFLSEGTGRWVSKKTHISHMAFAMPIGFACILGLLQLLYYPILFFNASFTWIILITSLVLLIALGLSIYHIKDLILHLFKKDTLLLFLSICAFLFVFSKLYIDLDYSDSSTYLNYIALNINAPALNMYSLSNGLRGQEWNIYYQYQGYYHFASYLCWLVNIPYYLLHAQNEVPNMLVSIWGLGALYHILSSALIINLVNDLKIQKWWVKYPLLFFGLWYSNFFYWNIAFAFYGNTYRSLFLMLAIYCIWKAEKEDNPSMHYLLAPILSAGLAVSSTYLFMGFSVLYAFAVYLFAKKESGSFVKMLVIITPVIAYVSAFLSRSHIGLAIGLLLVYGILLVPLYKNAFQSLTTIIENLFFRYGRILFLIVIPVLFAIGSLIIHLRVTNDFTSYLYYFKDFSLTDMMTDYLFINPRILDKAVNVFRWLGVIVALFFATKEPETKWIHSLVLVMVVFFLNPLCTILLLQTITGMVFYRNFMVLFNPLTEILFFYYIYQKIQAKQFLQYGLSIALVIAVVMGNVGSFLEDANTGLYWVYIRGGKEVDSVYKLDMDELQAIQSMRQAIREKTTSTQPVIVSQSGATLTYIPEAYQLFGPWQYYYAMDRLDEEFYQIARKPEYWQQTQKPNYDNTCIYLRGYHVNYVLLQYWQSEDFDEASDGCTVTIYEGSKYKVKEVHY